MSDNQYELLQRLVIRPLKVQGAEVFIFGSRVEGKHHSHSDVDLLYRAFAPLPPAFLSGIREAIEESRFPFLVDLVEESDLAESYRASVLAQRRPL